MGAAGGGTGLAGGGGVDGRSRPFLRPSVRLSVRRPKGAGRSWRGFETRPWRRRRPPLGGPWPCCAWRRPRCCAPRRLVSSDRGGGSGGGGAAGPSLQHGAGAASPAGMRRRGTLLSGRDAGDGEVGGRCPAPAPRPGSGSGAVAVPVRAGACAGSPGSERARRNPCGQDRSRGGALPQPAQRPDLRHPAGQRDGHRPPRLPPRVPCLGASMCAFDVTLPAGEFPGLWLETVQMGKTCT